MSIMNCAHCSDAYDLDFDSDEMIYDHCKRCVEDMDTEDLIKFKGLCQSYDAEYIDEILAERESK